MSRNREKIDERISQFSLEYPNVKFLGVQADLSSIKTVQGYRELVQNNLEEIDIGVLCLNAGAGIAGPVDMVKDVDMERIFVLNSLQVVYFTKAIIDKQMSRDKKSALLVTSSIAAHLKMPC